MLSPLSLLSNHQAGECGGELKASHHFFLILLSPLASEPLLCPSPPRGGIDLALALKGGILGRAWWGGSSVAGMDPDTHPGRPCRY